tara:strand:- start:148 stop:786 length:639 start_codon:yes stop_codon:yes gene_type:complete
MPPRKKISHPDSSIILFPKSYEGSGIPSDKSDKVMSQLIDESDYIKLVSGSIAPDEKVLLNTLGYSLHENVMEPPLKNFMSPMDDTSDWILRPKDKKAIGQIDWSIGSETSEKSGGGKCEINKDDIYMERIDVWDIGKGYGSEALRQKHKDWKDKGFNSVTLFPMAERHLEVGRQKRLYNWYENLGYEKSTKCEQHPDCDGKFTCFLTKILH